MKSKLAPWTLPDISFPILGWRMLKGRLVAEGRLSPDLRRYIGLPIIYLDPVGKVAWTSDRNLMNDDVLKRMTRGLAAKMEDDADDPRNQRLRAEEALERCRNQLVQQAQATKTTSSDDDVPPVYESTPAGLWWNKDTKDGIAKIPLTNFAAKITGQVQLDDGVETSRTFELEATLKGRRYNFSMVAAEYSGLGWVTERMGAEAIIFPGFAIKDNARAAIQILSGDIPGRQVYTHTGWREVEGAWVYLHGGGAIGELGPVADIEVTLPLQLQHYLLPDATAGNTLQEAIQASLKILDVAGDTVTVPLLAGVYRAVLGMCNLSIFICGETGAGKTEVATLAQQHFGAGMDARHLPASWESTANSLQVLTFSGKDALMVVDDFAPSGSLSDIQQQHRDADRLFRSQANKSPRNRLRSDSSLRTPKEPRGLILATGEDVPRGHSLGYRMLKLHLPRTGPGAVDWNQLTECQKAADSGRYAQAMSGFIRHIASDYQRITKELRSEKNRLREEAYQDGQHHRTPDIVADLVVGFRYFLDFAQKVSAIKPEEYQALWDRAWNVLIQIAEDQGEGQVANDPAFGFLELLNSCISSGRAHLASPDGKDPHDAIQWGWRNGHQTWEFGSEHRSQGKRIGWIDGDNVYLDAQAAYAEVQELARQQGDSIAVTLPTLKRRLHEKGLLASTELDGTKLRLEVRRRLQGRQKRVLHICETTLVSYCKKVDSVDSDTLNRPGLEEYEHENTPTEDTEPESTRESTNATAESTLESGVDSNSGLNNLTIVSKDGRVSPLSPLFHSNSNYDGNALAMNQPDDLSEWGKAREVG